MKGDEIMEVKDIIKQRRLELGYSMKELGKRVGVSEATISRWESGDIANMKRDKIKALAQALRISPNSIMEWEEVQKTGHDKEYYDPETLEMAQALYDDPELRALMKAAMDVKKDSISSLTDLLHTMKETNPNG